MKPSVVDDFDGLAVYCATSDSLVEVQRSLVDRKFTVYVMNASSVVDKETFLYALGDAFSMPDVAPAEHWGSWDSAFDHAWDCLLEQPQPQAAILVENADALVHRDLSLFVRIVEFFALVARDVSRPKVLLRVVFFGDGRNFQSPQKAPQNPIDDRNG